MSRGILGGNIFLSLAEVEGERYYSMEAAKPIQRPSKENKATRKKKACIVCFPPMCLNYIYVHCLKWLLVCELVDKAEPDLRTDSLNFHLCAILTRV